MDEVGFRKFLKEGKRVPKGLTAKTIRSNIEVVKEFESYLKAKGSKRGPADARANDVKLFMAHLAEEDRSKFDTLLGLVRYSRFCGNEAAELALINALDGANVIDDLCKVVKTKHGKRRYEEVLGGFVPPPIGTPPKKMPKVTSEFMDRMESCLGERETREVLLTGVHAGPPSYYADEKEMLLASKDVDDYLRKRREKFIGLLDGHMKNRTLFFTQMIDKDVMAHVRKNPEVAGGVRKGNKIYCTKIPYMAIEYLKEKDGKLKRYYGCHCPLARESIMSGKKMSRNLCYCSAGYEKMPFEVAFGEPVRIEILKSILWGDAVCRFSIEIPEKHRPKGKAKKTRKKGRAV